MNRNGSSTKRFTLNDSDIHYSNF